MDRAGLSCTRAAVANPEGWLRVDECQESRTVRRRLTGRSDKSTRARGYVEHIRFHELPARAPRTPTGHPCCRRRCMTNLSSVRRAGCVLKGSIPFEGPPASADERSAVQGDLAEGSIAKSPGRCTRPVQHVMESGSLQPLQHCCSGEPSAPATGSLRIANGRRICGASLDGGRRGEVGISRRPGRGWPQSD
jgi:hypothetical protein